MKVKTYGSCKIENETTYEIDNKKYKVITRCVENPQGIEKLYELISKYIISEI